MIPPNSFDRIGNFRLMYWGMLENDDVLEFELVDYFNSPIIKKGNGVYQVFYAIAKKEYDKLGLMVDDALELHVSYKCFVTALSVLPNHMRIPMLRKNALGKNALISFSKDNSKSITVHDIKPIEPTKAQIDDSKKLYALVLSEHKNEQWGR